jgi:hypothetical protein
MSIFNWPFIFSDDKGGKIPERQVSSTSEDIRFKILGQPVEISGGFMESSGMGTKTWEHPTAV